MRETFLFPQLLFLFLALQQTNKGTKKIFHFQYISLSDHFSFLCVHYPSLIRQILLFLHIFSVLLLWAFPQQDFLSPPHPLTAELVLPTVIAENLSINCSPNWARQSRVVIRATLLGMCGPACPRLTHTLISHSSSRRQVFLCLPDLITAIRPVIKYRSGRR